MKLIKAIGFIIQFSLIGLGLAALYVLWQADDLRSDIFGRDSQVQTSPVTDSTVKSYADAVASSSASVVTIYTSKTINRKPHPLLDDPIFKQFFGDQLQRRQRSETETNLGSGVIVSHDGYIVTNQHVINGADEILVALPDGRGSQATLVGEDRETDLAVLHIPVNGLSPIKIAETQPIRVGDVVLAIGNPLNVGQTVTMGIISATGRNRVGLNTFENFIQTDAAINPGNSGGALVNAEGKLIGINTAIFSQSGGSQGIGFAIPVSIVLDIKQQIIEQGKVSRGWLGVEGTRITAKAAMATGNPNIAGALIVGVFIDSPADKAGIRAGDIIVAVNREAVNDIRDLLKKITRHRPGDIIEVTLYRGSQQFTVSMHATERP
ncbi:MAG: trypsin-like peptidase domain-containing protein [Gammaproteobacteria bacterium]|nr:trypsin-like peptidase domain-containing protein [Gammaproteobacteria bacterium]